MDAREPSLSPDVVLIAVEPFEPWDPDRGDREQHVLLRLRCAVCTV